MELCNAWQASRCLLKLYGGEPSQEGHVVELNRAREGYIDPSFFVVLECLEITNVT